MQNVVPDLATRSLARRWETYVDEVRRLVDAGFEVLRRTGDIEPTVNDVVAEAGLSKQAFYRHFRSKDELLVAMLEEGLALLVEYLERLMAGARTPAGKVRRWVEGVMAQAADPEAAARTRPFVVNTARLADRFPAEMARSERALAAPLLTAVRGLPSPDPERDTAFVYRLVMGTMHAHLLARRQPTNDDVGQLVAFALAGARRRAYS
jgi:AcrR family transcriptional regulator